ncbi:DUF3857 domain-containing protein [Methylomonas sp. AM2-LC]|uniref:DUF3857 domain-containing protein n=1 Tax=Methylomonas sp. AM2-LC TaxID=3153301 RepID=UPI0032642BF5
MKISACLWLSLLLLACTVTVADTSNRVFKLAGNMPNQVLWSPVNPSYQYRDLLPQPDKIATFKKLGYGSVTLGETHQIWLRDDKTVEETVSVSRFYMDSNGIETVGNSGFWIDSTSQRVEIKEAYVLQPDGSLVSVDAGNIQINGDNSTSIFNDYSYVTIPFSQLIPGSISILTYKIVTYYDKLPLPWFRALNPANFGHIERFQAQINWAKEKQKPAWKTDYAKLVCKEGALSLTCNTLEPSLPVPTERGMPAYNDVLPVLVLAEATDWNAISNKMQTYTEPALSNTTVIKDLADQLLKEASSAEDKLQRLATYVAREIRYVGIEHGYNGVVPRPTLKTLERRFGDCKDKTMLFVDLARQAGLDAYPVLTSTNRHALSKLLLPSLNYFNHMIACVKLSAYKDACIDLTDSQTSPAYLPNTLQGAVSLSVGRGADAPSTLDSEPYTWVVDIKANHQLTDDGSIIETLERHYDSHWAAGLRHSLVSKSQDDQDRSLLEYYRSVMGDKVTPTVKLQGLEDPNSLLVLSTNTEFRNAYNAKQLINFSEIDHWLRNLINNTKTTNVIYPYSFQGINYKSQISYKLENQKRINNIGPKLDYTAEWGSLHRYYRNDETSITAFTELKMPRLQIPVEKIAEFNRFLDLLNQETRIVFSVQK